MKTKKLDVKNKWRFTYAVLAMTLGLASCKTIGKAPVEFEEGHYEVIDTGLEQSMLYGPDVLGAWLDNQRLIINALKDARNPKKEEWIPYLVIFDVKTRKTKLIAESVYLLCRIPETQIASIVEGQNDTPRFVDKKSRFVKMDEEGKITTLQETPPSMSNFCRQNSPRKPDRLQAFLRVGDGYIDRGKTGGGHSYDNAVLYRPNQPPIELPIHGGDIYDSRYISHLNLYQLSAGPSRTSGKPVFSLMTPDGDVIEISQPKDALRKITGEAGIFTGGPGVRFMRDGLISRNLGAWLQNPGMFFIQGEKVTRIWGANGELAERLLPSPDGCTLAFLAFNNYDFATKKTVKLINLCEGK